MTKTAMDPKIALYQQAGEKAAGYTLSFQQPDGGYIWEGYPSDAYHKQPYSWGVAGQVEPAHRLLTWVKANALQPDGQLKDYQGDIYKHSWLFHGAHRLGRFDLTYPLMSFLLSCQAPGGGFPHFAGEAYCRSLSTCMAGLCALYLGRLDAAAKTAEWAINLLERQPDEQRFYYRTTLDGDLVTPATDADGALYIDRQQPKQVYWEIGLPLQLMCRMYQATGDGRYLGYARSFFEATHRCYEDSYTFTGSGKSGLGAAVYYLLTGDRQARSAACGFAGFLLETQLPDGSWRNPDWPPEVLYSIDASAEFNVWLQEIAAVLPGADVLWGGP
jgi:hypothetical protein